MKRKFTAAQLDQKIAERWPTIGEALRQDFVERLMCSKWFPKSATLEDFCFSPPDESYSSEHLLLVLARYCFLRKSSKAAP